MKERIVYQCEHCRKVRFTKTAMERHEVECVHNPLSVNCYRCAHAFEGNVYDHTGYPTGQLGACCNYTEDAIVDRMAHKCSDFVRSETMWYTRRSEDEALQHFSDGWNCDDFLGVVHDEQMRKNVSLDKSRA